MPDHYEYFPVVRPSDGLTIGFIAYHSPRDAWFYRAFDHRTPDNDYIAINFDGRGKTAKAGRADLEDLPSPAPLEEPLHPPVPAGGEVVLCQGGVDCPFPATQLYTDGTGKEFDVCGECFYRLTLGE